MRWFIYLAHDKERHVEGDPEKGTKKIIERDKIVFYNEKHALVYGRQMKEYLGMIDSDDSTLLEKSADELRVMNLPKIAPRDLRRADLDNLRSRGMSLGRMIL